MKKFILLVALVLLGLLLYFWPETGKGKKSIAIFTTLSHPALENARLGFLNALSQSDLKDVNLLNYNAEGNLQQANLIAQNLSNNKNIVGIFAIGTLAAQTVAKAEKKRPIVIAAVSDPKVVVRDVKQDNVCGLTDSIDAEYEIETIMKLFPKITSISFLFSPSEDNSTSMVKRLNEAAQKKHVRVVNVGIHEPQQIMTGSKDACQKSDAVVIPLDNQLAASMPAVIKATRSMHCAIITSHESPIHDGAALAFGVDYRKSGEAAGSIMEKLLTKKTAPKDIGFLDPQSVDIFVNDAVVKEKGIDIDLQGIPHLTHIKGAAE